MHKIICNETKIDYTVHILYSKNTMFNNGLWNKKLTTSDVEVDNKSSLCCLDLLYITHFPTIKLAVIHVYIQDSKYVLGNHPDKS